MKIKTVNFIIISFICITLILGIYLSSSDKFLSATLFSGAVFFYFLFKNKNLLLSRNIKELDESIKNLKHEKLMWLSFVIFIISFCLATIESPLTS